jgi:hypothetical protein
MDGLYSFLYLDKAFFIVIIFQAIYCMISSLDMNLIQE